LLEGRHNITTRLLSLLEPWAALSSKRCPPSKDCKDIPDWFSWTSTEVGECPLSLLYKLDHKYSDAELSFARLKGPDQAQVAELRKACEKIGLHIYLANIEQRDTGIITDSDYFSKDEYRGLRGQRHDIIEESLDSTYSLSHIIDPTERVFARKVEIDETIFVQEEPFDSEPDEEDFEGYTGNEGACATHIYRETVCYIHLHDCFYDSQVLPEMRLSCHCSICESRLR
jgi:hypothetical protein